MSAEELDHFLISPNDNPLSLTQPPGWLSPINEDISNIDQEQFLLNANDLCSDDD